MRFSLQAGLTLKFGANLYEVVRQLDDQEFQLEETRTRRAMILTKDDIVQGVYSKKYEVILGSASPGPSAKGNQAPVLVDLGSLTQRERTKLDERYMFVKAAEKEKISRGDRDGIKAMITKLAAKVNLPKVPSASSVMKWLRDYQKSDGNHLALVDRYRFTARKKLLADALEKILWQVLRRSYFTKEKYSAKHAFDQLQLEIDKQVKDGKLAVNDSQVSYQTFTRRINEVDKYHRIATREGPARARMVCRTSFPDGYPQYPLERVEIDHTPLNWVVICDRTGLPLGRPVLSVKIDAYSGYVLGFYLSFHGPGVTSICGLVRSALTSKTELARSAGLENPWLSHGIGDEWVVDNGLEFHSFAFQQIAMALGVDLMYCRVRTPWLKPRVERFFSTLNTLTLIKGKVSKRVANVMNVDPYKDAAITFGDLVTGLLQFFVDVHPFEPNWRKMARPYDLFKEGLERCPPASFPGNLDDLRLASGMSKVLTFGHGGIENFNLPYGSYDFKELANRHGTGIKVLCKWDPDDMYEMQVQDPKTLDWMTAQCRWKNYAQGLSFNQHRLIRKFAKAELQGSGELEKLLQARQRLHDHWMDATTARRRASALQAARYADLTSSRVVEPVGTPEGTLTPTISITSKILLPQDMKLSEKEIPVFDSFSF